MRKKLLITMVLMVLLSLTMVERTWAQVRTPGVAEGNTFIYDVIAYWSSTDPLATISPELLDMNQTEYVRVGITGVSGSDVTTFTTWQYKNGTVNTLLGSVNLETGAFSGGFWAIIAGNLTVNDRIHPTGQDTITVTNTVIRNYLGGNRETNHLIIPYQNTTERASGYLDRYFDKETGMLVELHDEISYTDPSMTIVISWKIEDSSVWVVPEFASVLVLPLFMMVTMLAAIAYKKKHASITRTLVPAKTHKF